MKKILIALLITPVLIISMLSFSVMATETPPVNTSGSDTVNTPMGSQICTHDKTLCDRNL